jgi:septal ring factor EnvC (AmiA/AmiB activator)
MLNWRPVVDYELREIEFERSEREYEQRQIEHQQRMKRLGSEISQIEREADRERERAARRAQRQAECNLVQLRHQLDPSEANVQRVRDLISLLEEYGGFA